MSIPIEDEYCDVIGKAQKGLGLTTEEIADRSGVAEERIRAARRGEFAEEDARSIAKALRLNETALVALGKGVWHPAVNPKFEGFALVQSPFHEMTVNAFLAWDPATKEAVAFDTGTDPKPLLAKVDELGLKLVRLLLTHAHWDHVEGTEAIRERWSCPVAIGKNETCSIEGVERLSEGDALRVGGLALAVLETPGHTDGGVTFVIEGLAEPVAVVGDALFAGSMGGANVSYEAGLSGIQKLMALDEATILAPGHGPLTTVREERRMNCFFVGNELL